MPIIVLIPAVICIYMLYRVSVQKVFLNVVIPVFIMFPIYFYWKVAALPPVDLAESVLFPLGVAMCFKEIKRWRFSFLDFWVALFVFCCFYSDYLQEKTTTYRFEAFHAICHVAIPYMAGKPLIEHNNMRVATLKRIVFCLFITCIISAYEYRMGMNPFTLMLARYFPGEEFGWHTSIRWGFGRVSGPYGQSELAGMVLFFGLVLALWLVFQRKWEPKFRKAPWLPGKKSTIVTGLLALTLLMTQARGPWIGAMIAIPIAMIGRAKNVLRTTVILGSVLLVCGAIGGIALARYADASARTESTEQENAQYRSQLVDHYWPIAQQGGVWGWGADFPRTAGQGSIDNEYLFVSLVQGMAGLAAFVAICIGTLWNCVIAAAFNPTRSDRYFGFSLLGIELGHIVTLFTVFLGNQSFELFFLLAGWSQAARMRPSPVPSYAFQQAYT
jgi:hypothetical protein